MRKRLLVKIGYAYATGYILQIVGKLLRLKRNGSFGIQLRRLLVDSLVGRVPKFLVCLFGGYLVTNDLIISTLKYRLNRKKKQLDHALTRQASWIAAVAASTSAIFLFIDQSQRMDLALFVAIRALDSHVRYHSVLFKQILGLSDTLASIIPSAIFQLSCWEIMYSWMYRPESLPRSYNKWISRLSEMNLGLLDLLRGLANGTLVYGRDNGQAEYLKDYAEELGLHRSMGSLARGPLDCQLVHDGIKGCIPFNLHSFASGFRNCIKIYGSVHFVSLILMRVNKIKKESKAEIFERVVDLIMSSCRSALFLTTFISIIKSSICFIRNTAPQLKDGPIQQNIASFLCGFAILIETRSRRREMALYCLPKALESFISRNNHISALNSSYMKKAVECLLFSSGITLLIDNYEHQPRAVPSLVRLLFPIFIF